ncbi:hypothetical protein [Methylobacterium persicinum]|uniref:Chitinase n=1 Tax=Methylobacterium persicinum TaxID=374426 RepID=A0ABU0HQS3_9HYPH|nr:hypothetical protein [Methylobacterium persicinum]MDQ0444678.1 putative chitinase [Methylobacterium persicinum]GJE38544.1 hypothetical protein KHHGKMAE_2617 [Methylobacterium persicinum]
MTALPSPNARAAFLAAARLAPFPGWLSPGQVTGLETILGACPPDLGVAQTAYCLATAFHETARTMQPIEEFGRGRGKPYGPSGFWGRGYVQLTWRANYARASARLHALGLLAGDEDLVDRPALALRPDVAAAILFHGMGEGWFTGARLSDFFGPGRCDPVGARRIVNGTDCAGPIAGYHAAFRAALTAAMRCPDPAPPPDPPTASPDPSLPQPAPSGGLFRGPCPAPATARPGWFGRLLSTLRDNLRKGA